MLCDPPSDSRATVGCWVRYARPLVGFHPDMALSEADTSQRGHADWNTLADSNVQAFRRISTNMPERSQRSKHAVSEEQNNKDHQEQQVYYGTREPRRSLDLLDSLTADGKITDNIPVGMNTRLYTRLSVGRSAMDYASGTTPCRSDISIIVPSTPLTTVPCVSARTFLVSRSVLSSRRLWTRLEVYRTPDPSGA
jgi:hypothetical protein